MSEIESIDGEMEILCVQKRIARRLLSCSSRDLNLQLFMIALRGRRIRRDRRRIRCQGYSGRPDRHVLRENIATAKIGLMHGIFDGGRASTVPAGQASRAV